MNQPPTREQLVAELAAVHIELQREHRAHETTRAHAQTAVDEINAAMRQLLLARDAMLRATTHLAK